MEKIFLNERYGAVEIDKTGIIKTSNNYALAALSGLSKNDKVENLTGLNLTEFLDSQEIIPSDYSASERIITSIKGIKLIDAIFYKETESVVVRFVKNNEELAPFFNIIKYSSSLFIELDNDFNIVLASDSFCKTAALEKFEIYGGNISLYTDKSGIEKIISAADFCNNKIINSVKIEEIQFLLNGKFSIYNMEVSPVKNSDGQQAGVLCHFPDITFEKKLSEMTRNMRRMSAIANFAGGIAHDYNNALTAVLGNISLAKMDAEKNSEMLELLRDAESAGLKIKTLTERLGVFARGMKPSKDKTDIKRLIEDILPEVFSGYKGHYSIIIKDNMQHPEIDRIMISEAIRHVVENAMEVSNKKDGEIVIESEEIEINKESVFRESTLVSGRYILVSVRDNGPGVVQPVSGEIFDPYVTTKPGREGLGLALTYTILKRHRGFISVESPETGGACFKIFLPLF